MMTRRRGLSDKQVAALRKRPKRYIISDPVQRGLYIRVPPQGPNTFAAVARDPYHRQVWATLGTSDVMKVEEARSLAREAIRRVKAGLPAIEQLPQRPDAFAAVAEGWIKRHVTAKGLRSQREIERVLRVYVLPHWAEREFESIRRSDVSRLLDHVEDHHGRRMADVVLATIRAITNWHASRSDDYTSPIARGMRRVEAGAGQRERILDDAELRAVWAATESGTFGCLCRVLLLSGQRFAKVQTMRWDDLDADGIWHIPEAEREKGTGGDLKLPPVVLETIGRLPRFVSNPYIFTGRSTGRHFNNPSAAKTALDKASGVTGWVLHDLRRTARSLMSRANVRPDIAEKVLGHSVGGVEAIYDRHAYTSEKGDALAKLAALIERIVNPPEANVVPLRQPSKAVDISKRRS
jgi:integrase